MGKVIWQGSTQLAPVPAVLVGTGGNGYKNNLITIAWAGIVCSTPPMLSISVRPERFSYEALEKTGEFTVNIPLARQAAAVDWCGVVSGRDHDKFAEQHLTALSGSQVTAPLVGECPVNLECKVKEIIKLGSHDMFIAEIVAVQVSEEFIQKNGRLDLEHDGGVLGYAHGHYFALGECLGHFGFSVRKKSGSIVRK
jgi:flavin reductase (DIM6/NTAB) family NADH-FMN oxidoreductase RutF